jgi:uncharacterized surface protein with fasciclin (FAS1) repeats
MRKALTLRALPAVLGATILTVGSAVAQDQGTRPPPSDMPSEAPPAPDAPPPAGERTAPPNSTNAHSAAKRSSANIVQIAEANAAFSTLVSAVKAADLAGPLSGPGPLTVFAPTNDAFGKLPAGTVDTLVKPENKAALTGLLTYHVVSGEVSAADIATQIQAGGGTASLTTMAGGTLTASMEGDAVVLTDAKGGKARVVVSDVKASNGIIHAIDGVVMP